MSLSKTVFRFLLVIVGFLTLLTLVLFPFQEPGTGSYVISVVTLVIQFAFLALLAIALYVDWRPLDALDEPQ
jgi:hypothetical protein